MRRNALPALLAILVVLLAAFSQFPGVEQKPSDGGSGPSTAPMPEPPPALRFLHASNRPGIPTPGIHFAAGPGNPMAARVRLQLPLDPRASAPVESCAVWPGKHSLMKIDGVPKSDSERILSLDAESCVVESAAEPEAGRSPDVMEEGRKRLESAGDSATNNELVIEVSRTIVVGELKVARFPSDLRMSSDGRDILVGNLDDRSVSVTDRKHTRRVTRVAVGNGRVQGGFTPDGRRVYVSLSDESSVAVIDTDLRRMIATVPVGRDPMQVFASPDARYLYVASRGAAADPRGTVSVIDTTNNLVVAVIEPANCGSGGSPGEDGQHLLIGSPRNDAAPQSDAAKQGTGWNIVVCKGPNGMMFTTESR